MSKAHPPELKKYMDKLIVAKLNGGRLVEGTLRGYDPFLNLVVENSVEINKKNNMEKVNIGMVVIRGSSIVMLESKERI